MTISSDSSSSLSKSRLGRRQIITVAGAAAAIALAPQLVSAASYPELTGGQSGTLTGNPGGSFAYYQISSPGGAAITLGLSYAPFVSTWAAGIGFNVYQKGSKIAAVTGATGLPASQTPSATFTPSASSGPVLVQLFNYSNTTVSYSLTSSMGPAVSATTSAPARYVYVGTYTAPNTAPGGTKPSTSVGIYVYKMTGANGALSLIQTVPTQNPSWVTIDPAMKNLYCTVELGTVNGKPGGMVQAYAINPANGTLTFLNQQLTLGTYPAHCNVHPSGRYLLGTNYGTGNFPIYPIRSDGSIGAMSDNYQDTGGGPNRARQEGPHAHMILTDPGSQHVFGSDLGTDRINIWTLDLTTGKLQPNQPLNYIQVAGGSGPRHVAFHPSGKWVYVIAEMASSITVFSYDPATGLAIWKQTVSTLPPDFTGSSACSEIAVHPSGRFLYGANRGHDSIVTFGIDPSSGKLGSADWQSASIQRDPTWTSTQGKIPRSFAIDPSGALLYAANQNSDNIVAFAIDPGSGRLSPTGQVITSPVPVSVAFGRLV